MAEVHHDASIEKLELTHYEIMHFVIKQLQQVGYHAHNIDGLEKEWEVNNALYYDTHSYSDSNATKYSQFKQHCILETCKMYNRGDKGGTNHSANMVSDQVTAQLAAIKEHNDHLEENQYKMADAIAQMVRGGTTIGGDGGILPVIDTKSMGTAPTEGNTDFSSLMAQQNQQHHAQLQAMQVDIKKLVAGGCGGGNRRRNPNKNPNDHTSSTKGIVTV